MENKYYGNPWSNHGSHYPSSSPYSNSCPSSFSRHSNPNPSLYRNRSPTPVSKPRVVSIPVHYVNSDSTRVSAPVAEPLRLSAEMAVTRLQKVMRGFLVRKNMKIVRKIEAEAEEIAKEIVEKEEVLERDEKDRIRIGEMLMRLLFKLDSVRGVRDYRKKVIKRVISLQEKVDSIDTRDNKEDKEKDESDPIELENSDDLLEENPNSLEVEENEIEETINSVVETPIEGDLGLNLPDETSIDAVDSSKTVVTNEVNGGNSNHKEDLDDKVKRLNLDEELDRQAPQSSSNEMEMKGVKELMESMLAESQKMKTLMEEICQRNMQQWRLMEGLADRVHRLERTVQKMERKDKHRKKKGNNKNEKCGQWEDH